MYRTRFSRFGCSFLMFLLVLPVVVRSAGAGTRPPERLLEQEAPPPGLSSLPIQAQASISAALGRDQRASHAKRDGRAWRLGNQKHGLRASFTMSGVEVRSGAARFRLRLTALGRGARLEAVASSKPEAKSNRIQYRRGALSEWYVNGPLGLEQGFTLDSPPASKESEALTLALRLSGDLSAVPDPRGEGMALQAPGGRTALRYRGLVAWDSTGRTLPAWWQGQGSEIRLRVDDSEARYPLTIDPIIEDARLMSSDGAAGDLFGSSVGIAGDTVVVGAFGDDTSQGSVYIFVRPVAGWSGLLQESAKLIASDGEANNAFGISVGVSGDTVVAGALTGNVGNNIGQGAAYVFVKPSGGWAGLLTEDAKLIASDGRPVDFFGDSVAVSGDTVVVRAFGDDVGENSDQGSAYIFVKPAGGWAGPLPLQENAKLVASDGAANDFVTTLGELVAVSGDTVVLGAAGDDVGPNTDQGSAYVFVKPVGGWAGLLQENAKLTASDGAVDNRFGFSVGASGDTVVVGTLNGLPAYVFVEPPGGWAGALRENARLIGSDGLNGFSVAASGDTVVVAPNVYFKPAGGWAGVLTENGRLTRSDSSPVFSLAVDVDGDTAVAGFCDNTTQGQGSACVFEGLETDTFEAEPAATRTDCKTAGCRIPITCKPLAELYQPHQPAGARP
ncbi:MAG: FG-GAP repeat protein [Gammaproteobacteria bacterium]